MEKKVQRQFDEKEGQIREEQLALVKKLGEAEQAAATMRDALVPASCQSAQCKKLSGTSCPKVCRFGVAAVATTPKQCAAMPTALVP